jgi:hypothetical protein
MTPEDCYFKFPFKLNFNSLMEKIQNNSIEFKKAERINLPLARLPELYSDELNKIFNLPDKKYFYHRSELQGVYSIHHVLPIDQKDIVSIPALAKWHKDSYRNAVIIIPISEDDIDHYTEYKLNDDFIVKVPYEKGIPFLLNTKIHHKVTNNSKTNARNVVAISFNELNFYDVRDLYNTGKLVNEENLKNSFLIN